MSNRAWESGNCDYCDGYNGHHDDDCPLLESNATFIEWNFGDEEREVVAWIDDGF